ncbi:AAA family ATPase, partial [bacterium]|nr:AAA family ATPase [bacterium]
DDFLKVDLNIADLKIIYEIINYRYKENKTTIFSSERLFSELAQIDEAIESRIFEKAEGFIIDIARDRQKNFRYKKQSIIKL